MTRPEHPSGDSVTLARRELQEIVEGLTGSETRLRAVHGSLASSAAAETTGAESEDAEKDVSTEIRTVIECVLTDSLRPAIRDLQAAALYGAEDEG